jgi:hypothetical protein
MIAGIPLLREGIRVGSVLVHGAKAHNAFSPIEEQLDCLRVSKRLICSLVEGHDPSPLDGDERLNEEGSRPPIKDLEIWHRLLARGTLAASIAFPTAASEPPAVKAALAAYSEDTQ